jgi:ABC-type branched-subunit amino acid transport system ATPase component
MRFGQTKLFRDVNFALQSAQVMAVVGENGVGKTTLLDCLSGDVQSYRGSTLLDGRLIDGLPPWRRAKLGVSRLYQDIGTFSSLSARECVLVALHKGTGRAPFQIDSGFKARMNGVDELLDELGVSGNRDTPAGALSWGNHRNPPAADAARRAVGRFVVRRSTQA